MNSKWQCLKIYHHINKSRHKQKAIYKTLHPLHKNKNTWFTLMTALLSDEFVLTKQSIPFSFNRSLSYPVFGLLLLFSNPNSTQTFSSSPMGLFPPQPTINFIISSILYCMSLSCYSPNENSTLFMAFLHTHLLHFSDLQYPCGVWPLSWRSEILVAPIQEQPQIQYYFVHKTGALECSSWLLFLGRCNLQQWKLQQGTRYWSQSEQRINLCWTWLFK